MCVSQEFRDRKRLLFDRKAKKTFFSSGKERNLTHSSFPLMQIKISWNKSSLSDEAVILTGAHPYKVKRMSLISSGQNSKNEP